MTDIRALSPVLPSLPGVERTPSPLEKSDATNFAGVLKSKHEASIQKQPASVVEMAYKPNIEAMRQQLLTYGKKHLYPENRQERSAPGTSTAIASLLGCITADSLTKNTEGIHAACPDGCAADLCITHLHDATAWLAAFCSNGFANGMPIEPKTVALPSLFVWVWVPVENVRVPTRWERPLPRRGSSVADWHRYIKGYKRRQRRMGRLAGHVP